MKCECGGNTFASIGDTDDLIRLIACENCGRVYAEKYFYKENKNENKKNN